MAESKGIARGLARADSTDGKGDGARSDVRIVISVFGSALTVAVALAALILTSAHYTRQQFNEQIELTRQHFGEQIELMRGHSDSQFGQLREDVREVRGDVRTLAERVARLEGLLLAAPRTRLVPRAEARGTDSPATRSGDAVAD